MLVLLEGFCNDVIIGGIDDLLSEVAFREHVVLLFGAMHFGNPSLVFADANLDCGLIVFVRRPRRQLHEHVFIPIVLVEGIFFMLFIAFFVDFICFLLDMDQHVLLVVTEALMIWTNVQHDIVVDFQLFLLVIYGLTIVHFIELPSFAGSVLELVH